MRFASLGGYFLFAINVMAQNGDKKEMEFGLELTSELQATNKGNYNNVNLLRLDASLPVSRNISIEAASITACMTASECIGGDLQIFSNLDAGNIPFALRVCGIGWQADKNNSLFVGIRNMNEDYFTSPVTSFFTNSSCGIYPTISANYPIANYPVASVGVHYRYENGNENEDEDGNENGSFAVQASLYNGIGYYRFTGRDNVFRVCPKDDGVFGIVEVSYTYGGSFYSFGSALYWNEWMSPSAKFKINSTPWLYAEQRICNNFTLIAGYSHAFTDVPLCKDFMGLGAHYQLRKCQLGVFTDYADFGEIDEFATELTCKLPLSAKVHIQPTVHIISTDSKLHSVAMLRMALSI